MSLKKHNSELIFFNCMLDDKFFKNYAFFVGSQRMAVSWTDSPPVFLQVGALPS